MDVPTCTRKLTDTLMRYPIYKVCTNPVYISFIITGIILLIVMCMYDEQHKIKTGFWIFITTMFAIFANNQFIIKDFRNSVISDTELNLRDALEHGPVVGRGEYSGGSDDPGGLVVRI